MVPQDELNYRINPDDVTDALILRKCRTMKNALRLCRDCSPLADKEIIEELKKKTGYEYQLSHFSEMLNGGKKNIDPDHIPHLEDICGNTIVTRYMALIRNCELRRRKEAWEIENEHLRAELEQQTREMEAITNFLKNSKII